MGAFRNIAAAMLVLACATPAALAQDFPTHTIRFVVPQPPGGISDVVARIVAEKLSEEWKQSIVIDNRVGAGGNIGTAFVARSQPDGYTWLLGYVGTHAINPNLYKNLSWDPIKDFSPVALLATTPFALVINKDLPIHNLTELIAYAKQHPGGMKYGSGGVGTPNHLLGALLGSVAGIQLTHVPYRGISAASTDLIAGRIQMAFVSVVSELDQIRSGSVRAIAVTEATRTPQLPDVPTIAESGLPGFDVAPWYGILTPANTPPDVVAKINAAVINLLAQKDMLATFAKLGMDSYPPATPAQFAAVIKEGLAKWGEAVKQSGARVD